MNIEENMMLATRRTKKKTLKWGFNKEDREAWKSPYVPGGSDGSSGRRSVSE